MSGRRGSGAVGPRGLPWWAALPAAAAGGFALDLANPGVSAWPLVFPAIALMLVSWWRQRAGLGLLAGAVAGAAFWFPQLGWLTLYLGPIPWLGLGAVMTAWVALQGWLTGLATRGIAAFGARTGAGARAARWVVPAQAVAAAGIWVLRESVQGSWPYGGFPWGRIAVVFAESPFGALVSWLGFAGLSGIAVLACAAIVAVLWGPLAVRRADRPGAVAPGSANRPDAVAPGSANRLGEVAPGGGNLAGPGALGSVGAALTVTLGFSALALVPPAGLEHTGELRVAAIQGNSKSGIFDDRENGDVYADHVTATEELLDELERSGDAVEVIVWPENAGEFGLTENPLRGREIALLSQRAGARIVVGTVLRDADGTFTNSSVVWGPRGQEDPLSATRYDKRFPVPFAEYMPNRDFFHAIVPDLVDLVQLEYEVGEREPVLPLATPSGELLAGVAICFDIIFDEQAVRMVGDGAGLILAPTNNADFGRTDESVQQLQIARLRAIETGRVVVNTSTVGTSRIIAADGADLDGLEPFTRGAMVATVPLVSGETPALRFGAAITAAWLLLGVAGVAAGAAGTLFLRRASAAGAE